MPAASAKPTTTTQATTTTQPAATPTTQTQPAAPPQAKAAPTTATRPTTTTATNAAATPPTTPTQALRIFPEQLKLSTKTDLQRFIVVYDDPVGNRHDVSDTCTLKLSAPGIVEIGEDRKLRPMADGSVALEAGYKGLTATAKISTQHSTATLPVSLRLDVEPVLMRAGCNTGACHGSFQGKNGFRLALFGFDADMDFDHLTHQMRARRLSTADPENSLMLLKPTTAVAHEGGLRFKKDSALYHTLLQWIREGAKNDPPEIAHLTGVEILPRQIVMNGSAPNDASGPHPGERHRIMVRATYSDGTERDVTSLAVLSSLNDPVAAVNIEDGMVEAKERGEATIIARYGVYAVATQVIVVPPGPAPPWTEPPATNPIDELIERKLRQMRLAPSPLCNDETFLRRACLDITGLPPTRPQYEAYIASTDPDKRNKLIDDLLARPEFAKVWTMKWAEMLRVESTSQKISRKAMFRYNDWLRDQIARDVPLDQMVRALLTARGGNFDNPATNFYLVETEPNQIAENVAQVFAGIRIQCAQCHNHPFERWTMDDYYSFSAFFAQVGRKPAEDPREIILFNSGTGEVRKINTDRVMPPRLLGQSEPAKVDGRDRREVLAEWLTGPDNPWFSKAFANRVWAQFMGRGVVDPPDDIRVSNPASNPELLEFLGRQFTQSGYNLRALARQICRSHAYQRASEPNETNQGDLANFSRRIPRRLTAEQLLDAIGLVTETPEKFAGLPLGAHATDIADGSTGNYFLDTFGRPPRATVCTCERHAEPTLSQALHLINGDTVAARVKAGQGRLARLLAAKKTDPEIIEDLYVAAFTRKPTPDEAKQAADFLAKAPDRPKALEDLFWALLNAKEFVFYH